MQPRILYDIPYATVPVRLIMGAVCMLFVVAIFGYWLPRVLKFLRSKSPRPNPLVAIIFLLPVAICIAPLIILVSLITNPHTFITETGVVQQSAFYLKPVTLDWSTIDHVDCHRTRSHNHLATLTVVGSNKERIDIGNASGVSIYSVRELLENQLGPSAMHNCAQLRP